MATDSFSIQLPGARHRVIAFSDRQVIKRDGQVVPWNQSKITRAIALAFFEVRHSGAINPHRDDATASYGLSSEDFLKVMGISHRVSHMLELYYQDGRFPTIEEIQDTVEKAIAAEGEWQVARTYILYRQKKAELRIQHYPDNGLADFIAVSRYARFRPDLGRRETFPEAVARVARMHRDKLGKGRLRRKLAKLLRQLPAGNPSNVVRGLCDGLSLADLVERAFGAVEEKRILPSMRSLQFGGDAVRRANARMFNCSFSSVDRVAFFKEYFYLLLAGCGCGFSVQRHHVGRLPGIPKLPPEMDLAVHHYTVEDTIEGWSDALAALFQAFLGGYKIEFNYSLIRPRGAQLRTSGGKAPGHLPLKRALNAVEGILRIAAGRHLKPVEAYDICMHVAKAVLSGGVRRSATICLFSADDEEMMSAKTGDWFSNNPQRSASNNSAVIDREACSREDFQRLFESQKEFGEPGFYFSGDADYGCNPCCEIGLNPVVRGLLPAEDAARLRQLGYGGDLDGEVYLSGWQMCNLSTINAAMAQTPESFYEACFYASVVGTIQATYTDIPYLGPVTRYLNERESLLGVSICGILDCPDLYLNASILEEGATVCRLANSIVAEILGIPAAARITCVKPEGTASLLLNTGSGIHPHHAKRYFRRVQANRKDPVYGHFREKNAHMTEPSVYNTDTDDVMIFPVEAPEGAIFRSEIGAVQFLEYVKFVQRHWVQTGRGNDQWSPGLDHNVSNTCTVRPDEWEAVADFIWENRAYFTGVALLPYSGDKVYAQAPREEVVSEEDIVKWNRLKYHKVDFTTLVEKSDETALKDVVACAGGTCELV